MTTFNLKLISIFCISIFSAALGQTELIVADSITKGPLENAYLFSSDKELIAISNELGKFSIGYQNNVIVKCHGYKSESLKTLPKDTIFLSPLVKNIDEVKVKPVDIPELYKTIIDSSKKLILAESKTQLSGEYYETVLIVDLLKGDSSLQTKQCNLDISIVKSKNKFQYELSPNNASKKYWYNRKSVILDTTVTEKWSHTIPTFSTLLEYDLTNETKLKINFKDKKINRLYNNFIVLDTNKTEKEFINVKYQDSILKGWSTKKTTICSREAMGVSICFEEINRTIEFDTNENGYFIQNSSVYAEIIMSIGEQKFLIKLKKGFVNSENPSANDANNINTVEDYFKTLGFSEIKEIEHLFLFGN